MRVITDMDLSGKRIIVYIFVSDTRQGWQLAADFPMLFELYVTSVSKIPAPMNRDRDFERLEEVVRTVYSPYMTSASIRSFTLSL